MSTRLDSKTIADWTWWGVAGRKVGFFSDWMQRWCFFLTQQKCLFRGEFMRVCSDVESNFKTIRIDLLVGWKAHLFPWDYLISYMAGNHIFSLPFLGDVWLWHVSTKKTSKHHEKYGEKSSISKNQDTIEQNIIHLAINSFLCTYLYKYPPGNLCIPREFWRFAFSQGGIWYVTVPWRVHLNQLMKIN